MSGKFHYHTEMVQNTILFKGKACQIQELLKITIRLIVHPKSVDLTVNCPFGCTVSIERLCDC